MAISSIGNGIPPILQNGTAAIQSQNQAGSGNAITPPGTDAAAENTAAGTNPGLSASGQQEAAASPAVPVVPATAGLVAPQSIAQAQESADSTDDPRALDSEERVETAARERQEKASENRERLNANNGPLPDAVRNAGISAPAATAGANAASAPAALNGPGDTGSGQQGTTAAIQAGEGQTTTASAVDSPRERNPLNLLI